MFQEPGKLLVLYLCARVETNQHGATEKTKKPQPSFLFYSTQRIEYITSQNVFVPLPRSGKKKELYVWTIVELADSNRLDVKRR